MKKLLLLILPCLLFALTACSNGNQETKEEKAPQSVKVQSVSQSRSVKNELEYPAMVLSEQEAKVIAKTSGTATQVNFKLGDTVHLGALLARIDDITSGDTSLSGGYNSSQIRQAQIAAEQAEINRTNISLTTAESMKSAQIAYDTAKVSAEQARIALENRKKSAGQSYSDTDTNANTASETASNLAGSVITGINNLVAYDDEAGMNLSYKDNLGVSNSQLSKQAENYYFTVENNYNVYTSKNFGTPKIKLAETIKIIEQVKKLTDFTKKYLDASLVGTNLPSATLSSLQSSVSGYMSQLNTSMAQLNAALQAYDNNVINNDSTLDSLAKAYEIAKQQEKNALQALSTQQATSKASLDSANMQYRNAIVALQSVMDVHTAIAPISGKIVSSQVKIGDTVTTGQVLATISQTEAIKFQIYVDQDTVASIKVGQAVKIKDSEKEVNGSIVAISGAADSITKRFLVEVTPEKGSSFALGTVVNIIVPIEKKVATANNIILPLSAIEIGQNENSIYIVIDGVAKKKNIELFKIIGETAEIKTDLKESDLIIIEGNKLIQEDEKVNAI